ncbi:metallophosphoesterase [Pseudoalteromonas sp. SR43-6]|nr:metallophosphoesterase [Pseudoalteromonas sp. SR41-5]MBB1374802.1 metallophosphoesterase [Pseudoalteromonas sp. SR43-6]MBB1378928.1 metallophosphoesterase [Pseudoalteromonas sp. SR43-2]MBB1413916.1 metallophosphoesterase [Pseudoalteromonas sp. SG43-8]
METVKVAFLADIHLHDIFANLHNTDNIELPTDVGSKQPLLVRSMYAQLHSTRLFNENYFVFLHVLDELVEKEIKLVILPGDFTDDGQPINVRALARILDHYEKTYGMRFFAIPGNHDPVKPFTTEAGKADFLTAQGKEFGVYSYQHEKCMTKSSVCDDGLKNWGYTEILSTLSNFGFSKHKSDVLYETPYENREFIWCDPNDVNHCITMPDASYLVEPIKGVWLMAIDANVYAPQWQNSPLTFKGSSSAGYNALIDAKPLLLKWIKTVVKRSKEQNKTLIAFSHFPMGEFYDNANDELHKVFSRGHFSLPRVPTPRTTQILADTGLTLHFAGHMHLNDTALVTSNRDSQLVNVQVPSLAAYKAAYKIAELNLVKHTALVSTHTLDDVPGFNDLFGLYEKEWVYREKHNLSNFDRTILSSESYGDFTKQHLFGLISQRFLKRDWPKSLVAWLNDNHYLADWFTDMQCLNKVSPNLLIQLKAVSTKEWLRDFYLLRNGDVTADITPQKRITYQQLNEFLAQSTCKTDTQTQQDLALLIKIMAKFSKHTQGENFSVDLKTGEII